MQYAVLGTYSLDKEKKMKQKLKAFVLSMALQYYLFRIGTNYCLILTSLSSIYYMFTDSNQCQFTPYYTRSIAIFFFLIGVNVSHGMNLLDLLW